MQLRKFVPLKAPGSPLIAGDLEGPEQLLAMTRSIGIQISLLLSELSAQSSAVENRAGAIAT